MARRLMAWALFLCVIAGCGAEDTTGAADTTPPLVLSTDPSDGEAEVGVNTSLTATFSEAMDTATTNPATFTLTDPALNSIGGTISYTSSETAMFTPSSLLAYSTLYTAAISDAAKDLGGNALPGGYTWSFTTRQQPWTKLLGTSGNDAAFAVAVDAIGNIYVAGYTNGDLDNNTNAGGADIFLVKYDPTGAKQWTRQSGTSGDDVARGVAVDGSGGIYVAGYTYGGLDGNTSAGASDLFLVKYDQSGVKEWTEQLGAPKIGKTFTYENANGVAADGNGNAYVTGSTDGNLDGNANAGTGGFEDLFLVKYDPSGVKQWTKLYGTMDHDDGGFGVAVGGSGNIYAAGFTSSWPVILVAKYDPSGVQQWTQELDFSKIDYAYGVAADNNDNVYITGSTYYAGDSNIILAKYDSSGVKQWTKQFGTSNNEAASAVAVDGSGNIYIAGYTDGGLDGNTNAGGSDIFLSKFDGDGLEQ